MTLKIKTLKIQFFDLCVIKKGKLGAQAFKKPNNNKYITHI